MRKLDDIIPPSRRRDSEPNAPQRKEIIPSHSEPSHSLLPTFIMVVVVIVVAIGALFYFSSTKVTVVPATLSVAVENSFTASRADGLLSFELVTAEKIASAEVKSTGTKTVNSFASGTITVYNTSSKSQRLIANTRFATTAGLVFRVRTAITVPAGTSAKPGSLTTTVYADKVGDAYNVGPTSFTVPGLADTPQATQIYARSTSAMTGGASGTVPTIDATVEKASRAGLLEALERDLQASIVTSIPEGYVLVPGASSISYRELPATEASTGMVHVREQGTITAVVFPNTALARTIAGAIANLEYQDEPLSLSSTADLSLTPTRGIPAVGDQTFVFSLSGTAPLVYSVDPTRISAALSGKTRAEAKTILDNYPEVDQAIIKLRPFWRKVLPEDPSGIEVSVDAP
jgi:cytoskeletal protein RodZ